MSHIVTIQTEVRDPTAVAAACRRLGLPEPSRHRQAVLGRGHRAARPPAWLALPRRARHRRGRSGTITTEEAGASSNSSTASSRPTPSKGQARSPQEGLHRHRAGLADGSIRLTVQVGGAAMRTIEITVEPRPTTKVRPRLRRRRLPRGEPVRRAGPGPQDRRADHRRVLPGPAGPPGPPAVELTPRHTFRPQLLLPLHDHRYPHEGGSSAGSVGA